MLQPKYPLMCPVEIKSDTVENIFFFFSSTHTHTEDSNTQKMSCKMAYLILYCSSLKNVDFASFENPLKPL